MSKNITLGFKRAGGKPDLIYGTETSFAAQRAALAALKKSDTYEKVEIWERGIPVKTKRIAYTNQPTLTVTAGDKTVVYGAAIPTYTATYAGWTDGDTVRRNDLEGELAFACAYTAQGDAGTYPITPSGRTSDKYNLSFVAGTLTVSKKALTLTVTDAEMVYGASAPAFTFTGAGYITGEDATDLTGSAVYTVKDELGEIVADLTTAAPGEYEVHLSGVTSTNYELTMVAGTLTITDNGT